MAPKFGTSGLRGLVTELTDDLVAAHVAAFVSACPHGGSVFIGQDLRASSPRIARAVMHAATAAGVRSVDCGVVPTPALAYAAMKAGAAAIMVTGSHIPADRNGLKFYTPAGEITKHDEAAIQAALGPAVLVAPNHVERCDAMSAYMARYRDAFGDKALLGTRVGVYQHSSVARDLLVSLIEALGGTAVPLARATSFVPVDTEAVDAATRSMLADWCSHHRLDTVVSTDGDADRPMVTDDRGQLVPGDVLGPITARVLGTSVICTPVSSNTLVDKMPEFEDVRRTKIGSPYVIAEMEARLAEDPGARVAGYEANGGFLLGFAAAGPAGSLTPLLTRDCVLPIVTPLAAARASGMGIAALVADLPRRFTASDRLQGVAPETARAFLEALARDKAQWAAFFGTADACSVNRTDGLRVTLQSGAIVHLRPSGNAPEFRCYVEAGTSSQADALLKDCLQSLRAALT